MHGSITPLGGGCGDDCCAHHGGMQCERCGLWFCTRELNGEGLCDECAEQADKENEE